MTTILCIASKTNRFVRHAIAFSLPLLVSCPSVRADEIAELRAQLRVLEQKIQALERRQELKEGPAAASANAVPKLTAGDGRVELVSADGATSLRLRGLIHADYRRYDAANDPNDTFLLRRARLSFEGRFNQIFSYVVQPELAGTVQILDANLNVAVSPALHVRVGKFKTPVGLEQLQSDSVAFFNERSVATNLTPNRDVGIGFHGNVLNKTVNYTVAVLNGVPDAGSSSGPDGDGEKTVATRVFATPFANDKDSALSGLGFGFAVSTGDYATTTGRTSGYRTDGQQIFFAYDSSVVAAGRGFTWSPQAYYYRGPFGILAEYVGSSIEVQRPTFGVREMKNFGYNLSVGYVLTGEATTYHGVTPKTVFNPAAGTWGAFEIVARLAGLDIDDRVFGGVPAARLANPNTSATQLDTYALGLNWFLSRSVRAGFNVYRNEFKLAPGATPAANAVIADDETTFVSRVQVAF